MAVGAAKTACQIPGRLGARALLSASRSGYIVAGATEGFNDSCGATLRARLPHQAIEVSKGVAEPTGQVT